MKKIRGLCLPVMLGAVLMSQHVHAVDNLTFRGKLIIPACTVSNTTVDWQDVEIQTLSQNGNHEKEFTVNMRCCHERCNSDPHPTPEIRSRG